MTFKFSFDRLPRALALPFGITPSTTGVDVKDGQLLARFGPWRFLTPLDNVEGSQATGPYATLLVIEPTGRLRHPQKALEGSLGGSTD